MCPCWSSVHETKQKPTAKYVRLSEVNVFVIGNSQV